MMYKVIIDNQEIEVTQEDLDQLDLSYDKKTNNYQVLRNGKSHRINTIETGQDGKYQRILIDNLDIKTTVLDPLDQLVDSMGLSDLDEHKSKNIAAPMPGLILEILCQEGDEVEEGKSLLILEAMKMENVIKAEGTGKIVKLHKSIGDSVDKGQLIIEIE